jgi:hypothetical protein
VCWFKQRASHGVNSSRTHVQGRAVKVKGKAGCARAKLQVQIEHEMSGLGETRRQGSSMA